MELRNFLLSHPNDWEEILTSAPYNLIIHKWEDFISFKYNMVASDLSIPLVQEARGVIFVQDNWKVVCRAFDKFFNYGESNACEINWNSAVVMEKIDGSLCKVFTYKGKWYLATNSGLNGFTAETGDIRMKTFGDIFELALQGAGYENFQDFTHDLESKYTYMFELVSPYNRVVIPYETTELFYLGQRLMVEPYHEHFFRNELTEFRSPKIFHCNKLEDVVEMANKLPWDEEGYVVRDSNFNRVKIKSPAYIMAHYMRNNNVITKRRLMEVILKGEVDEFLCYAADYNLELKELQEKKSTLEQEAKSLRHHLRTNFKFDSQKDYASIVNKISNSTIRQFCFTDKSWEEMTKDWSADKWVRKVEEL